LRVLLALIHNNDLARLETARQTANFLLSQIRDSNKAYVDYLEIFEQEHFPEISGRKWRLTRRISNSSQYKYLRFHLEAQIRRWVPFLYAFFADAFRIPGSRARWKLGVEHAVTKKHLQVLDAGLEYDFTVVIEDDAVILPDFLHTGEQISALLQRAFDEPSSLTYIDFAGGFRIEEVAPASAERGKFGSYISSSRLFTNTACGYALSSSLAKLILREVAEDPRQSWLGIDFLLNRVFCNRTRTESVNCFHLTQSPIRHGSMNGNYMSWEKSDPYST
jgi:hypothetical protein